MNYTTIKSLANLYNILADSMYLSGNTSETLKEASFNAWGIMLDDKLIKKIKAQDFDKFFLNLIKIRGQEISMVRPEMKVTLYVWFDHQSLRLCFNVLSGADRELPFACTLNIIDSPDSIYKKFIKVAHDNLIHGNYLGITEILEKGDLGWDDDEEDFDPKKFILDVWKITFPWNGEIKP